MGVICRVVQAVQAALPNFLSLRTTITLFRIKDVCISIYIHKTSPHAAEIRDRVVYYSTNVRG